MFIYTCVKMDLRHKLSLLNWSQMFRHRNISLCDITKDNINCDKWLA